MKIYSLLLIAYITEAGCLYIVGHRNGEVTVNVGGGSLATSVRENRDADQGLIVPRIDDCAADCARLSHGSPA